MATYSYIYNKLKNIFINIVPSESVVIQSETGDVL